VDTAVQAEWERSGLAKQLGVVFYPEDHLRLYAYRAFPWKFAGADLPALLEPRRFFAAEYPIPLPEPGWAEFERLGYDVVQLAPSRVLDLEHERRAESSVAGGSYGCSPLSCNGLACLHPVNRYCLFDDLDTAYRAGLVFGREEPEPGPYVVIEVLRCRERANGSNDPRS
jgi:hypothetical protein